MAKLNSSILNFLKSGGTHARLNHLTLYELNSIRPILPHALNQVHRMAKGQRQVNLSDITNLTMNSQN